MTNDLWVLVKVVHQNRHEQTAVTICHGEGAAAQRLKRSGLLVEHPNVKGMFIPSQRGFDVANHLSNLLAHANVAPESEA